MCRNAVAEHAANGDRCVFRYPKPVSGGLFLVRVVLFFVRAISHRCHSAGLPAHPPHPARHSRSLAHHPHAAPHHPHPAAHHVHAADDRVPSSTFPAEHDEPSLLGIIEARVEGLGGLGDLRDCGAALGKTLAHSRQPVDRRDCLALLRPSRSGLRISFMPCIISRIFCIRSIESFIWFMRRFAASRTAVSNGAHSLSWSAVSLSPALRPASLGVEERFVIGGPVLHSLHARGRRPVIRGGQSGESECGNGERCEGSKNASGHWSCLQEYRQPSGRQTDAADAIVVGARSVRRKQIRVLRRPFVARRQRSATG